MPSIAAVQIYIDLSTLNVIPIDPTPCPYYEEQRFVNKAVVAYDQIVLALDEKERIESLVHAFYLGELLKKHPKGKLLIYGKKYLVISLMPLFDSTSSLCP
ncbi:4427_t:CDS:1 [Dentiscutata erythropus]|uniref:4427_t:CDS:1 n=1 Tax=Dentiscutata erythropus TaxID=1348616 RepID=A0A9N9DQQ5_9GLOM|nr:4427_t:CDS:1 [Dentiscutata erythropus]